MAARSRVVDFFRKMVKNEPIVRDVYRIQSNNILTNKWIKTGRYREMSQDGFMSNVIVNRAVSLIAKNASSVDLIVYTVNSDGALEEKKDRFISNLLKNPNPRMGGKQFIDNLISYFLISGNAYVCAERNKDGLVESLELLRPDRIEILTDVEGELVYKYKIDEKVYHFCDKKESGIDSDLMHLKNFNPLNDHYGLSVLESAKDSILQHNECIKWNKSLIENGARPSGAIIVKNDGGFSGSLTQDQFEQIRSQLRDSHSGSDNVGKVLILEGGLDWKEMSISPKDMEFLETKNGAARDIALAIGVPPQLLGIKGDSTYSNISEARIGLWEETILPMLENFLNRFSCWFSNLFEEDIKITYDPDSISSLLGRRQMLWENLKNSDFLTVDEKREMLGFDKLNK